MKVLMIARPTLYTVPGGDTVQMLETAKALRKLDVEVDVKLSNEVIKYGLYDLIHFFNIIRPHNIRPHLIRSDLPYVVSTIYVDYSEIEKTHSSFFRKLLYRFLGSDGLSYLKTIARYLVNGEKIVDRLYFIKGHKRSVENILQQAKWLLPNSESEYKRLKNTYNFNTSYSVIPNAVSEDFIFEDIDLNKKREGVLCIARIEIIKNQLNLIKAVRGSNIKLKIIGKPAPNHIKYYEACKQLATENIEFLGHLDKNQVIEELKKAKVHVLPSFFETTGLSSLEALAMGCNIVVTPKGDVKEYFDSFGLFCNPDDPQSIREAIEKAQEKPINSKGVEKVKKYYNWKIAAKKTKEAYEQVIQSN